MDSASKDLKIVHADPLFAVVEKPGGLLSVPGRGPDRQDCVSSRFRAVFPDSIEQPSVHRLDMETSGLMVLARTKEAHRALSIQFQDKVVQKRYIAVLDGVVEEESGEIELPFRVDIFNRPYQMYDPIHGKIGHTLWRRLGIENGRTRIEYTPVTGRTHQLRVHSAHRFGLGLPIVGDSLYGSGSLGERMLLHAAYLRFRHPESGEALEFTSPPPF